MGFFLYGCTVACRWLNVREFLVSPVPLLLSQPEYDGVADNPNVFLKIFLHPCSIIRLLLYDVFMRNTRGNKIKYIIPTLITTGMVVDLKICTTILAIRPPIISNIEIIKVTWALTRTLLTGKPSASSLLAKSWSVLGGFSACLKRGFQYKFIFLIRDVIMYMMYSV